MKNFTVEESYDIQDRMLEKKGYYWRKELSSLNCYLASKRFTERADMFVNFLLPDCINTR